MSDKKHFFLKLNPPRTSFMHDMTDEERRIMQKHVEYWAVLLKQVQQLYTGQCLIRMGVMALVLFVSTVRSI
jgi:hypothetical protein